MSEQESRRVEQLCSLSRKDLANEIVSLSKTVQWHMGAMSKMAGQCAHMTNLMNARGIAKVKPIHRRVELLCLALDQAKLDLHLEKLQAKTQSIVEGCESVQDEDRQPDMERVQNEGGSKQAENLTPVSSSGLDVRTKNCLEAECIKYVEHAQAMSDRELLSIPNFGRISLARLRAAGQASSGGSFATSSV